MENATVNPEVTTDVQALDEAKKVEELQEHTLSAEEMARIEEYQEMFRKAHTPWRLIQDVGRNDPCPCGSGKKFKNCCMNNNVPKYTINY